MNFRYNFTGNFLEIGNYKRPEYETLFLHSDNKWHNTTDFNSIVDVEKEQKEIYKRYIFAEEETFLNFYEFEIDVEKLKENKFGLLALRNYIIASIVTSNYQNFASRLYADNLIDNSMIRKHHKVDWFGAICINNFSREIGLIYPELFDSLSYKHPADYFEAFRFILLKCIDYNEIFKDELQNYNRILNIKISNN